LDYAGSNDLSAHDAEVKALTRLAIVYDIALALNRKSTGLLLASLPALEEGEAHA
jgi:methylglyoxal synthase